MKKTHERERERERSFPVFFQTASLCQVVNSFRPQQASELIMKKYFVVVVVAGQKNADSKIK